MTFAKALGFPGFVGGDTFLGAAVVKRQWLPAIIPENSA